MKHTIYLLIVFILSAFLSSCSKDELVGENKELPLKSNQKSGVIDNEDNKDSLPKLKFIPKGDGTTIYTIVLKDPAQTTPVIVYGRVKYNVKQFHFHAPPEKSSTSNLNDVVFLVENFNAEAKVKNMVFPAMVENQILDLFLEYREGDVVVKTFEYSLFVFADGKTALQKPEIKKAHFVDDWQGETGYIKLEVKVENDPAEQVAAVEVVFDEKTASPAPISYTNYLKTKEHFGALQRWHGMIAFAENPQGQSYTIKATLLDINGKAINEPTTLTTKPVPSKPKPSIHNVYIRELKDANGMLTHEMAGIVLNIKPERLDYVEVTFNKPFEGPAPETIIWRMRKRPELLYQAWDDVINDYISEIQNNPLACDITADLNPLFNQGKLAVGYIYSVTAAMFDRNSKQIGEAETFNVTVTGNTESTEPVLQSMRLFSADGGKSSTLEVVVQENGQKIEKLQVEFLKPFEGPAPVYNTISLTLVGEKEGNLKIYSCKVEFVNGADPSGYFYYTNFYRQGGGGGGFSSSVVARAPSSAGTRHEFT